MEAVVAESTDYEVFAKAPIQEALIDLRVKASGTDLLQSITDLGNRLEDSYPHKREIRVINTTFAPEADESEVNETAVLGQAFLSDDGNEIIQARINGFTYSRLHPYPTWSEFSDKALSAWEAYQTATGSRFVERVAVRYINRLDFKAEVDLEEYLTVIPALPDRIGTRLTGFFNRYEIPKPDLNAKLVLTLTGTPPPNPDQVSVAIDIGLYCEAEPPSSKDELVDYLGRLRIEKNEIFLACITEKTKEMIRS